jgi:hypothetical protein
MDEVPAKPIYEGPTAEERARLSEATAPQSPASAETPRSFAPAFTLAAWIVPGLGHLLLRRWGKAVAFFVAVAGLALCGYAMRGDVFAPGSDGSFGTLGFVADFGSGMFYFLSRWLESSGGDLSRAAGDYGTRLLAAAGIVNALAIIDAYETATRHRS